MRARPEPSLLLIGLALVPLLIEMSSGRRHGTPPALPRSAAGLQSVDLALSASERLLLAGIPATKRLFTVDGHHLRVLVMDATVDRHAIHDPAYCLQGKGWRIVRDAVRDAPGGQVRVLHAERGEREVLRSVSFYEAGGRRYTSPVRYLADYARARWLPSAASGVRYAVVVINGPAGPGEEWVVRNALPRLFAAEPGRL